MFHSTRVPQVGAGSKDHAMQKQTWLFQSLDINNTNNIPQNTTSAKITIP